MRSRFESACDAQGGLEAAMGARTLELMDCEGEQGAPTRIQVQRLIELAKRKSAGVMVLLVAATAPLSHGASCSLCQGRLWPCCV